MPVRLISAVRWLWLALVVAGSLLSDGWKKTLLVHGPLHLAIHFIVFLISGLLVIGGTQPGRNRIILSLALIELAFILEAVQMSLSAIQFEWLDFLTDSLGVLAGLLLIQLREALRPSAAKSRRK